MIENWKTVVDYPNYEVSSLGKVRRATPGNNHTYAGKILKPQHQARYPYVSLCDNAGKSKSIRVHVIVCRAFNGPKPSEHHHAAHEDDDTHNLKADNMSWKTPRENLEDKLKRGRQNRGVEVNTNVLGEEDVRSIRRFIKKVYLNVALQSYLTSLKQIYRR